MIVSGSSTFDIKSKFKDSLVGRTTIFEIFPLDFEEYLEFKKVKLIPSKVSSTSSVLDLKHIYTEYIKYGAYPKVALEKEEEKKKKYLLQVVDTYLRRDIRDLAHVEDIKKFNNMLKVLAFQSGQLLDMKSLSNETNISFPTLQKYISILEETFVIKIVSPYSKNPSVEISKNPKVFMYDSGLQSILWTGNFQSTILGSQFETNIFGELVKTFGRENINFWRTKSRQEIDFIVNNQAGSAFPLEVKINFQRFKAGAINMFCKKYKIKKWGIVGLEGEKTVSSSLYPWELLHLDIQK